MAKQILSRDSYCGAGENSVIFRWYTERTSTCDLRFGVAIKQLERVKLIPMAKYSIHTQHTQLHAHAQQTISNVQYF